MRRSPSLPGRSHARLGRARAGARGGELGAAEKIDPFKAGGLLSGNERFCHAVGALTRQFLYHARRRKVKLDSVNHVNDPISPHPESRKSLTSRSRSPDRASMVRHAREARGSWAFLARGGVPRLSDLLEAAEIITSGVDRRRDRGPRDRARRGRVGSTHEDQSRYRVRVGGERAVLLRIEHDAQGLHDRCYKLKMW